MAATSWRSAPTIDYNTKSFLVSMIPRRVADSHAWMCRHWGPVNAEKALPRNRTLRWEHVTRPPKMRSINAVAVIYSFGGGTAASPRAAH